jgi:hypothetical protein
MAAQVREYTVILLKMTILKAIGLKFHHCQDVCRRARVKMRH